MAKKSIFAKITGLARANDDEMEDNLERMDEEMEGQLAVDMYQTPSEVIIKAMVAGVKPEDLDISITREMVTIKGTREESNDFSDGDFFHKELFWGSFSRTIVLPQEVEVEEAEAVNKNGLLVIKLPKLDKNKQAKIKVKSA